ncbi:hypothetical protein PVIIG_05558 [Plasmodium vivax India VII]|uniref:Variable surface protein Vir35 n=1 Tax=Plasmodium vivax India VII TaxID=1077284 RepID=A0A0J9SK28_PLAVI|nr:hypothetical protein PVIIG_05558 [Plasmodium vivax India VII]
MGSYFIFKIFALVFLIWKSYPYDYKCDFGRTLEKISKNDNIIDIGFKRSLAKHEFRNKLEQSGLREELKDYRNYKVKKNSEDISAYGGLKRGISNKLDTYKKGYKDRYGKKKGLAKLDCYYENKIFNKIDNIYELTNKINNKNKSYNKKILGKYVISFILFALLPFLGIIFPILIHGDDKDKPILPFSTEDCKNDGANGTCQYNLIHISQDTLDAIVYLNKTISFLLLILVVLSIVYTFIKVIKYEKLKANKGKMNAKEYCRFCKDTFFKD